MGRRNDDRPASCIRRDRRPRQCHPRCQLEGVTAVMPPRLLLSVLAALFFLPLTAGAQAPGSEWPNKPIKMIVPWAAGGPTDSIGRVLTQKMAESMGQQFVIDNKPGATGTIGHAIAARSAPDGYTVLFASN